MTPQVHRVHRCGLYLFPFLSYLLSLFFSLSSYRMGIIGVELVDPVDLWSHLWSNHPAAAQDFRDFPYGCNIHIARDVTLLFPQYPDAGTDFPAKIIA